MESSKTHVCSIDKRRFATKAALAQHRRDSHSDGGPVRSPGKPAVRNRAARPARSAGNGVALPAMLSAGTSRQSVTDGASRASGSDVLAVISIPANAKSGSTLAQIVVNPLMFEGTRLHQMSTLWNRWRPLRFTFRVQSTLPTTAGGQLIIAWSAEAEVRFSSDSTQLIRELNVLQPHKLFHGWETASITPTALPQQRWLFVREVDNEDSRYGMFLVVLSGAPALAGGSFQVTVVLDWDVMFDSPYSPPTSVSTIVQADEGYYPYFTTYSTHLPEGFTSAVTMQENSNGGYSSIVRFSEAKVGVVYTPLKSDSIQYYDSGSNLKSVGALVRMKEVPDPFMWCFADKQHAQAYIADGSVSRILAYVKGGPWTTGNPDLQETTAAYYTNVTTDRPIIGPDRRPAFSRVGDKDMNLLARLMIKGLTKIVDQTAAGTSLTDPSYSVIVPVPASAEDDASSASSYEEVTPTSGTA